MGKKRGQAAFEYIMVVAAITAVVAVGVFYVYMTITESRENVAEAQAIHAGNTLIKEAADLYYTALFGKRTVTAKISEDIYRIRVERGQTLVFETKEGEIIHQVDSDVPIKIVGYTNGNIPETFVLMKEPGVNFTLICEKDLCRTAYCPGGGMSVTYCRDADTDTYGDPLDAVEACSNPGGYVANCDDCDDTDGNVHPGALEICENSIDENCDGSDMACPASCLIGTSPIGSCALGT